MKTSATNRRVHQLLTAIAERRLNPRPDFQRRLVWTNDDKVAFLRTVLRGLPFPEIYVCAGSLDPDTGVATEFLVDGQQRVTTLYQYFKGDPTLRLGKDFKPYADLPVADKEAFLEYEVVVRDLGKHDIQEIREIFELINSANYALNTIEIKNARYAGEFKKFCEGVADRREFKEWKIFTRTDVRRMQDLRYCLVLVATLMSTYFNRDEDIGGFLKNYNDSFPDAEALGRQIDQAFSFVSAMELPADSRAFRKTDLFSLLVEIHRALFKRGVKLEPREASHRLQSFYQEVDAAAVGEKASQLAYTYYRSTVRAAIDRGNRVRRGEILQSVVDPQYEPRLKFATDSEEVGQVELELEEGDYDVAAD
jgi:hypothetical protein